MSLTNKQTMFGYGALLPRLYTKSVGNQSIVEEEENGYGYFLINNHVTELEDEEVRKLILQMSVLEIIS